MVKIGWDIGHGTNTFPPSKGVYKNGKAYHEHTFNSLLGIEAKRLLELNGFQVYMAQKPFSRDVPLYERGELYVRAGCDLVFSGHANASGSPNANGRCAFYWHSNKKTKRLAEDVIAEIKKKGYTSHGNGLHASEIGSWTNLYITRAIPLNSLLVEHGFMTGNKDFNFVFGSKQKQYVKDMAEADVRAICKYFGRKFKGGKGGSETVDTETVYRVQIGAYKHLNGAAALSHEIESKTKLDAYLTEVDGLIKVQVGAFHKKANAEERLALLISKGYKDAFITTKSGTAVQEAEPHNDPIENTKLLKLDGSWGWEVNKALQRAFGTPVDGIISGQYNNATTRSIYGVQYGRSGSLVIKALQRKIGVKADGYIGPDTVRALQRYLGTPVDGVISRPRSLVVERMQRRLNDGTF